jgi:hypothetical protein
MRKVAAIAGIGILAATMMGAATSATAVTTAGTVTVYITQSEREVLDVGAAGVTIGDVVTGSGSASRTRGGAEIGTFAYRAETVRVNIPGGVENRLSTFWVTLPKGTLAATALVSVPQGTRPVGVQQFVIIGGTGAYAGVRGTMNFKPLSPDEYRLTYRFVG